MKYTASTLPHDHKLLHDIVLTQQEKLAEQEQIIETIRQQYDNLQHQLKCLLRNQYGRKSEQGIPGQGNLFDSLEHPFPETSAECADAQEETITYTRKKSRQQCQLPAHLPRQRIEYDLPDDKKICDCGCQQPLKKIGEETFEQLEVVPAQCFVIQHVRFKYGGCAHDSKIVTADMPRQPLDKAMAGPGLLGPLLRNVRLAATC